MLDYIKYSKGKIKYLIKNEVADCFVFLMKSYIRIVCFN